MPGLTGGVEVAKLGALDPQGLGDLLENLPVPAQEVEPFDPLLPGPAENPEGQESENRSDRVGAPLPEEPLPPLSGVGEADPSGEPCQEGSASQRHFPVIRQEGLPLGKRAPRVGPNGNLLPLGGDQIGLPVIPGVEQLLGGEVFPLQNPPKEAPVLSHPLETREVEPVSLPPEALPDENLSQEGFGQVHVGGVDHRLPPPMELLHEPGRFGNPGEGPPLLLPLGLLHPQQLLFRVPSPKGGGGVEAFQSGLPKGVKGAALPLGPPPPLHPLLQALRASPPSEPRA